MTMMVEKSIKCDVYLYADQSSIRLKLDGYFKVQDKKRLTFKIANKYYFGYIFQFKKIDSSEENLYEAKLKLENNKNIPTGLYHDVQLIYSQQTL
jgi:hypothetical protein